MPIEPLPNDTIDDGNDISITLIQRANNNLDLAYDDLVAKGRGIIKWKELDSSVTISSIGNLSLIDSMDVTLQTGRLYRIYLQLDLTEADSAITDEYRQYLAIHFNDVLVRDKYFYVPRSPDLEAFVISDREENTVKLYGKRLRVGSDPTNWGWTTSHPPILYVEDMGDPKGISLT